MCKRPKCPNVQASHPCLQYASHFISYRTPRWKCLSDWSIVAQNFIFFQSQVEFRLSKLDLNNEYRSAAERERQTEREMEREGELCRERERECVCVRDPRERERESEGRR